MNRCAKQKLCLLIPFLAMLTFFVIDICVGTTAISIQDMLYALSSKGVDKKIVYIMWKIRLPAAITAINVGIALGVSGACMQTILNNPLASPYTLGVSASSGFGASLAIVTGCLSNTVVSKYAASIFAVITAMLTSILIYFLSKLKNFSVHSMILAGISFMFLFQSMQAFLQFMADSDIMQSIVFWNFGSMEKVDWNKTVVLSIVNALVVPVVFKESWNLTSLKLGDVQAKVIGVNVDRTRMKCFVCISIISAVSVSFVGSIGFIGIVAPHISRALLGDDQRYYLVSSGIIGAAFLSVSSILSKILIHGIIFPIGIITSIIGVPFFILILFSGGQNHD